MFSPCKFFVNQKNLRKRAGLSPSHYLKALIGEYKLNHRKVQIIQQLLNFGEIFFKTRLHLQTNIDKLGNSFKIVGLKFQACLISPIERFY